MPKLNGRRSDGTHRIKRTSTMSFRQTALFGLAYADALDRVKATPKNYRSMFLFLGAML